MALEKQIIVDKIEIVGDYKMVQVRTATRIVEDGNVISSSYHRHVVAPGQDYSAEDAEVKAVCAAVHTPEIVAAYQAHLDNQENN